VVVGPDSHFCFLGDYLYMFPLSATNQVELRYSSLPPAFTGLANGDTVVFPSGYEAAYLYKAAARCIIQGEKEENNFLSREAAIAYDKLLSAIKRRRGPAVPFDHKSGLEFGSTV
jgi:hypothetical protein